MAATVFTGSGNWSYTNTTGGNVRVIIAYCHVNTNAQTTDVGVKQIVNGTEIGRATSGTNAAFRAFGKHINYAIQSNSQNGFQAKGINSYSAGGTLAEEFFLADGMTASLEAMSGSYPLKHYNIMVIPEGN